MRKSVHAMQVPGCPCRVDSNGVLTGLKVEDMDRRERKVISIEEAQGGTVTTNYEVKPRVWGCKHRQLTLDEDEHAVYCKQCGIRLDPYAILAEYAAGERRTARDIKRYEAACREFKKIQEEWSLTQRERRRLDKVMSDIR